MARNKLGAMTVDEVLGQLKDAQKQVAELKADIARLTGERDKLQEECNKDFDRLKNLKDEISKKLSEADVLIKKKNLEADSALKTANAKFNEAGALKADLEKKMSEIETSKKQIRTKTDTLDTMTKEVERRLGNLKEVSEIIRKIL